MTQTKPPQTGDTPHRAFIPLADGHRWDGVEHKPYKEDDRALFKDISRQTLFARPDLAGELRYFEVAPNGFSTLERHKHVHAVLILCGSGQALVGDHIVTLAQNDLITIPSMTWHQFRATSGSCLGFLCMVDAIRDKPLLPSDADLTVLKADPVIAAFLTTSCAG